MAFNDRNFRGNSGGNSGGFRGNSGPREMHTAVCSDCNVETQVPFKPDPERPVYCRDCLPNHRTPRENRY